MGNRNSAAKYTIEREGHVREGWKVFPEILKQVCADSNEHFLIHI